LHATGKLYAAKLLLEMALLAQQKLAALDKDHYDYAFYQGKVASARFFVRNILPEVGALVDILKEQDCTAIEVEEAVLGIIS
ncbi:MAG TPA: acyl-CoA dehydrogenase C-terminal domain-containing protein, partial [Syntrophomonadaceae bacterium]|nr:acyl-CoA dehydrogenase C-terminal domain-containing protein [Syntrophomonadaceae bacterium]